MYIYIYTIYIYVCTTLPKDKYATMSHMPYVCICVYYICNIFPLPFIRPILNCPPMLHYPYAIFPSIHSLYAVFSIP